MKVKQFRSLISFRCSHEFLKKDLSYCDLSNLNLSKFPSKTWENFKFYHTNFSNTNIIFDPTALREDGYGNHILEYCDFTNCDLSGIDSLYYTSIIGSNFINTGLKVPLDIHNTHYRIKLTGVIFSKEMELEVRHKIGAGLIDIDTVILNPHISFHSLDIYKVVHHMIPNRNKFITSEQCKACSEIIDKALEEDRKREGILDKLYHSLDNGNFSVIDKIHFFQGTVSNKDYDKIDLSFVSYFLLSQLSFQNCKFNQITLPEDTIDYMGDGMSFIDIKQGEFFYTVIPHIIIPKVDVSSWKDFSDTRLDSTCFTTQTNLYLELGRGCNANCFFCRNQFLEKCDFDFARILDNLDYLAPYLNNVVIGGGEPTLLKDYLRSLSNKRYQINRSKNIGYYVSTNGSCGLDFLLEISRAYRINLSRHAILDDDNNQVFGIKTLGTEDIKKLCSEGVYLTLAATCFEGGLDTVESLEEYIALSEYARSNAILFQTLHYDLNYKNQKTGQIDDLIFDEVIIKLREQGYYVSELPVYSTGDYKLTIVKSSDEKKTISFKKYISKEELQTEWYRASKRTFDLSMAPNADIYQNWHQSSDKILVKKI